MVLHIQVELSTKPGQGNGDYSFFILF